MSNKLATNRPMDMLHELIKNEPASIVWDRHEELHEIRNIVLSNPANLDLIERSTEELFTGIPFYQIVGALSIDINTGSDHILELLDVLPIGFGEDGKDNEYGNDIE